MTETKQDFKHEVFSIISQFTGQNNILTVNVSLIDFVGDLETGLFLSQVIYWADRTKRKDGFFYKNANEWYEEIRLSEYAVRKAKKKLTSMGIIETKIKKANGNPTTHYKLIKEAFVQQFISFLRNQRNETSITQEGNDESDDSLTDITSNITSDIYKKNKGAEKIPPIITYSFQDYKNEFTLNEGAAECVEHYLSLYQEYRGKEHPKLKQEQWNHVVENLFYIVDENNGTDFDLTHDEVAVMDMMEKHFKTKYKNCDYNILHFMSDGVRVNRMYEVAY